MLGPGPRRRRICLSKLSWGPAWLPTGSARFPSLSLHKSPIGQGLGSTLCGSIENGACAARRFFRESWPCPEFNRIQLNQNGFESTMNLPPQRPTHLHMQTTRAPSLSVSLDKVCQGATHDSRKKHRKRHGCWRQARDVNRGWQCAEEWASVRTSYACVHAMYHKAARPKLR